MLQVHDARLVDGDVVQAITKQLDREVVQLMCLAMETASVLNHDTEHQPEDNFAATMSNQPSLEKSYSSKPMETSDRLNKRLQSNIRPHRVHRRQVGPPATQQQGQAPVERQSVLKSILARRLKRRGVIN